MPAPKLSTTDSFQRQTVLGLLAIFFIFAVFRLPGLGVPLASDELATVSLWAQMPYLKILSNYQYPNNHIFLSLVLSFLLKAFGLKEWLLRMPLLACGLASIYSGYLLGKKVTGSNRVGLFTAFLMTICEKHIFYSTNARGYIVNMFLALLAVIIVQDRLKGITFKIKKLSYVFNQGLVFIGWSLIWIIGTWTVPTFLFFEVTIALFLTAILLTGKQFQPLRKQHLLIPVTSCLIGGSVFYFQFYVLIDSAMLAAATARAATTTLPLFFPAILNEWFSPFEQAGVLFLFLALLGARNLFRNNQIIAMLISCVCLGPVFIGIVGYLLGILPGIPHPRTYYYLQPFVLMLTVSGVREIGMGFPLAINKKFNAKQNLAIPVVIAVIIFVISCLNFFQHIYPKRVSRDPLDKVQEFVEKLEPNDLVLVSKTMHVGFYLYGARAMRERVENILQDGEMGEVYFLGYKKNMISINQEIATKDSHLFNFPVLTRNAKKKGPALPEKALEVAGHFGPFVFYQLKEGWLQPLEGWEKLGLNPATFGAGPFVWEKFLSPSGARPLIRFRDSFTVAIENKKLLSNEAQGLILNLVEVSGFKKDFSAAFVGGNMDRNSIILDPSWLPNDWVIDHPYGGNIFNRSWNPAIFVSQGTGSLSVMDVKFKRHPRQGAFRKFLSYRIKEPGVDNK